MTGYSGYTIRSDYLIDTHETKKSAMEFLKQLAYESGDDIFTIGKAMKVGNDIVLTNSEVYKYSRKGKDWFKL
jgi:hypothetical protein